MNMKVAMTATLLGMSVRFGQFADLSSEVAPSPLSANSIRLLGNRCVVDDCEVGIARGTATVARSANRGTSCILTLGHRC